MEHESRGLPQTHVYFLKLRDEKIVHNVANSPHPGLTLLAGLVNRILRQTCGVLIMMARMSADMMRKGASCIHGPPAISHPFGDMARATSRDQGMFLVLETSNTYKASPLSIGIT